MVLKSNKRILENGISHQPVKYYRSSECYFDQLREPPIIGLDKESNNSRLQNKADSAFTSSGHESICFSGVTNLSNGRHLQNSICSAGKKQLEKQSELSTPENYINSVDGFSTSAGFQNSRSCNFSPISDCPVAKDSEITNAKNTPDFSEPEENVHISSENMTETSRPALVSGSSGDSVSSGDGYLAQDQKENSDCYMKDIEGCTSVSNVADDRKCKGSDDFDLHLVSASSEIKSMPFEHVMWEQYHDEYENDVDPVYFHQNAVFSPSRLLCFIMEPRRKVAVGPDHQADIPICRPESRIFNCEAYEMSSEQDQRIKCDNYIQQGAVGSAIVCNCSDTNSLRCIKEHVEAARTLLKDELGDMFYSWGINDMGESVSEKWSREEEKTFIEIVSMHPPSSNRNFWNYLSLAFPSRTKKELVSYYFNVFILRRRALQNRIDPYNPDSDDDETDWHTSDQLMMVDDDESSLAESDASDGDDDVAQSDEENTDDIDEEYAKVPSGSLYKGKEKNFRHSNECDSLTEAFGTSFEQKIYDPSNCSHSVCLPELVSDSGIVYLQDNGNFSGQPTKSGYYETEANVKVTLCSTNLCKDEKMASVVSMEDVSEKELSSQKEFSADGPYSLLEPCDSKIWDIALSSSLKADTDKLVSTCSMIKELFGDEGRVNISEIEN